MKRFLPLAIILIAGILAIVAAQWQRITARPSPQAILTATADAEHSLTRLPSRLDRLSDPDEIALGNDLARSYAARYPTSPERTFIEAYLQTLGTRVAAHARRRLPYIFHFIPDPAFVNAFALPGGHVFLGQGLLTLMHSEDALAAVLGHEVEHIDLRHCADRAQAEATLRQLGPLAALPIELFLAGYSKEQELEADRDGTTLAVLAGYSPIGILQLFAEFEKLEPPTESANHPATPIGEAAQLSLQTLSGYFSSHPPSVQRAQQVRDLMRAQRWPTPPLRPWPPGPLQPAVSALTNSAKTPANPH